VDFKHPIWAFGLCVVIVVSILMLRDCGEKERTRDQEQWTLCVKTCGGSALVNSPATGCFCIQKEAR
jgi:hypothetical protein